MNGIAFNLPRTVTLAADAALLGLGATHGYVLATVPQAPGYLAAYCLAVAVGCLAAAGMTWIDAGRLSPALGWLAGGLISAAFVIGYLITRLIRLPGLPQLTGRWDLAPGSLALACAGGFLVLALSVRTGVNVAFGQHREWAD